MVTRFGWGPRAAAWLVALALGWSGTSSAQSPATSSDVPPRTRVAGIDSLRATSRVTFATPGAAPHVLEVSYAFPARTRASLRREDGDQGARVLRYRRGERLYGLGPGEATSAEIEGAACVDEVLALEGRLALLLWPESHAWTGEGATRRATLPGLGALEVELERGSPGDFPGRATLPELPRLVRMVRADGTTSERFEVRGWAQQDPEARTFPRGLRLVAGDDVVWNEEFLAIERSVRWSEDWFVPPDRRAPRDSALERVRAVDLLETRARDVALVAEGDTPLALDAALARARALAAEVRASGLALAPHTTLVLAPDGTPRAARLELAQDAETDDAAWRALASRPAWVSFCDALDEVDARRMRELERAAPHDRDIAHEWLLTVTDERTAGVRLLLAARDEGR